MSFNFTLLLTSLVILTGIISLIDVAVLAKIRYKNNTRMPKVSEYARSFFPVLLLVWVIRSFIVQPYRVPTGSLEPTVLPGDFILVNQFAYGLRLPVLNKKLVNIGKPKRGDIVLFHWPVKPSVVFVKRLIGLPGDHVVYRNKTLTINGKVMSQRFLSNAFDTEPDQLPIKVEKKEENLAGLKHGIYVRPFGGMTGEVEVTVPKGGYFVMGDNRDDSDDSRVWGFVPERLLIGKAMRIWMSWDSDKHRVRWQRVGKIIG